MNEAALGKDLLDTVGTTKQRKSWPRIEPWRIVPKPQEGETIRKGRLSKNMRVVAMEAIAPLLQLGYTHQKIADTLGLTYGQVSNLVKQRIFTTVYQEYQAKMLSAARDALMSVQPYAIWTLFDLLSNGNPYIREKAANDLLAHGKLIDQATGGSGGDEQRAILQRLSEELDRPRTVIEVIVDGQGHLRTTQRQLSPVSDVIDGVSREIPDVSRETLPE